MTEIDTTFLADLDDETLADVVADQRDQQATAKAMADAAEAHLLSRMRERDATWIIHPRLDVNLEPYGSRQYDPQMVKAKLGEKLPPDLLEQLIVPEHEETKVVPEKVDGKVALKVRKLGAEYDEALNEAMLPQAEKLVVRPKEAK